jgi:hypothetical protein
MSCLPVSIKGMNKIDCVNENRWEGHSARGLLDLFYLYPNSNCLKGVQKSRPSSVIRMQFRFIFKVLSRIMCETFDGFGLEIGFIDHINSRLVTTLNYNTIADYHILHITTTHTKSYQSSVSSSVVPW